MTKDQYDKLVKWCVTLESGQYKQSKKSLRDDEGGYCCLGVALDMLYPNGWSNTTNEHCHGSNLTSFDTDNKDNYLDQSTLKELGLSQEDQKHLSILNDTGYAFADIAKYIRKNILIRYKGND